MAEDLGAACREVARGMELTQEEVALCLDLNQATVSRYFRDPSPPGFFTHAFLCARCRRHFFEQRVLVRT